VMRDIDLTLRVCANDMWSQFDFINRALQTTIDKTTEAKKTLQLHLQRVGCPFPYG